MNASPKRFLVFSGLASQKPVWRVKHERAVLHRATPFPGVLLGLVSR